MLNLKKPAKLCTGDKVALVSLSWGAAGDEDLNWRYRQGKERIEKLLGVKAVEMPNTLKGADYLYEHPEKRAEDLMEAFSDKTIKGIISCIGGEETIRLIPYIDYNVISLNPKIFMGYSDTTVNHFMCLKAGISSFYGSSVLSDFSENVEVPAYTVNCVKQVLFSSDPIGKIEPCNLFTEESLDWNESNKDKKRTFLQNNGYELLQGSGTVKGKLIGGCVEAMSQIRGTELFPPADTFENTIFFLETSEDPPPPWDIEKELRSYGTMGILSKISALFFGRPRGKNNYEEYKKSIIKVMKEYGCSKVPVLYNGSFGHNAPKAVLPYGAIAEINCESKSFSIIESAVL